MGNRNSTEEQLLSVLKDILPCMGFTVPEESLHALFQWAKAHDFTVTADNAFSPGAWQSVGGCLWFKITNGDTSSCSLAATWSTLSKVLQLWSSLDGDMGVEDLDAQDAFSMHIEMVEGSRTRDSARGVPSALSSTWTFEGHGNCANDLSLTARLCAFEIFIHSGFYNAKAARNSEQADSHDVIAWKVVQDIQDKVARFALGVDILMGIGDNFNPDAQAHWDPQLLEQGQKIGIGAILKTIETAAPKTRLAAPLPVEVNPRGLKALQLWQTDVTHIAEFGQLKYVHVSIDTFSSAMWASAHTREKGCDGIAHWKIAFVVLGIPSSVKTDNGPA
ncbi:hypothetical protein HGM15179_019516 [Zosterops borbonicus]|uniref:Integrase catalytic domain-containing protein n=1 Tax=Zosterops borbonicus TaxID=364589 RepID=A0A8K1D8N0_9PASS|nr:hypothetical protein HGM15179_019516 [Zosterops borbonicus]